MKVPMTAVNTIKIGADYIAPGSVFDAGTKKEARILQDAGAAVPYVAPPPEGPDAGETAEQEEAQLIARIEQARTVEELAGLVNEQEERPAVREAFAGRMDRLTAE